MVQLNANATIINEIFSDTIFLGDARASPGFHYATPLTIIGKIGDKFLDMKGNKIVNLGVPTETHEAATKGYVDIAVSGITPGESTVSGDTLSKSTADSTYLKLDGTSVM